MKKHYFIFGFILAAMLTTAIGVKAATTVCNVFNGCTGWGAIQSGTLLYGNGTGALATTTAGTNGNILGLQGGIPKWIASTTYANGTGITTAFANNTLTITNSGVISLGNGTGITCSGTNPGSCSISAPVSIANGGTNSTTLGSALILSFNGTSVVATSTPTAAAYLATSTTATSTLNGALQVGTNGNFRVSSGGQTATCESALATSTSMTIDFQNTCTQVLVQIGTANPTVTLSNAKVGDTKRIIVANPNGTAGTITWAGLVWIGGTAPTQTTTANGGDIYSCIATQATSTTATSPKIECAASAGLQ